MKSRILLIAFSFCLSTMMMAQKKSHNHVDNLINSEFVGERSLDPEHDGCTLFISDLKKNYYNHVSLENKKSNSKSMNGIPAEFDIEYIGFTPEAREGLQYAFDVLSTLITTPVPIRVQATYTALDGNSLAGATFLWDSFVDGKRYPSAILDKLAGFNIRFSNVDSLDYDIVISINRDADWHFSPTDTTGLGNKYDLSTVMMHEIVHGLGFSGRARRLVDGTHTLLRNSDGEVSAYDSFVEDGSGTPLVDLGADLSNSLKSAMISGDLFFNSPGLTVPVKIHAPAQWAPGTSFYHLDESTTLEDDLMTPFAARGVVNQDPGVATQMLLDMGWDNTSIVFSTEERFSEDFSQPLMLSVDVYSDSGIDSSTFNLIYSQDSFQTDITTVPMALNSTSGKWEVSIPGPNTEAFYQYKFELIQNFANLKRSNPAPFFVRDFHVFSFVKDEIQPEINHSDIQNINSTDQVFSVKAFVVDSFLMSGVVFNASSDIDTVIVEHQINDGPISFAGGSLVADGFGEFYLVDADLPSGLTSADVVNYRIIARDASEAANEAIYPADGSFVTVPIIDVLEPVESYTNDFNDLTNDDFTLDRFQIGMANGFDDGLLMNRDHPYRTAGNGNTINFSATLKKPIIIAADSASAFIKFKEIVLVEPGEPGTQFGDTEFWDYVIIEAKNLNGGDWVPLLDGYDCSAQPPWNARYTSTVTATGISSGTPDPNIFRSRELSFLGGDLPFVASDTVLLRFRLFSDPGAAGWGWLIENLNIQDANTNVAVEDFIEEENQFLVYPNPSNTGMITVAASFSQAANNLRTELTDIHGRLIRSERITNGSQFYEQEIDISDLPAGIYFMTLRDSESAITKKVVKY